jgi:hypothetical protein
MARYHGFWRFYFFRSEVVNHTRKSFCFFMNDDKDIMVSGVFIFSEVKSEKKKQNLRPRGVWLLVGMTTGKKKGS